MSSGGGFTWCFWKGHVQLRASCVLSLLWTCVNLEIGHFCQAATIYTLTKDWITISFLNFQKVNRKFESTP